MKIFGYGTFITSGIYQRYKNVRQAFLSGYVRVQRPVDPFPYILALDSPSKSEGFWGLVFEVDDKGLEQLDFYEGSLYKRIHVSVMFPNGTNEMVMVYYPTDQTISHYQLIQYVSEEDPWRLFIQEHPEITKEFPELKWEHGPLKSKL